VAAEGNFLVENPLDPRAAQVVNNGFAARLDSGAPAGVDEGRWWCPDFAAAAGCLAIARRRDYRRSQYQPGQQWLCAQPG